MNDRSTAKRDFLAVPDMERGEIHDLLERAIELKTAHREGRDRGSKPLEGRTLAMIFRKSSTRTRVSFEAGMAQLGGHAIFLADRDSQMGRGESAHDTARVLSGYVDAIMIRTFEHAEVEGLARFASIPVINGLTDLLHPCQLLADMQTMLEEFGPDFEALTVAWIGDGNNMANSWLNAARAMGFRIRLACPEGYRPDGDILEQARAATDVLLTDDPAEAAEGAHVVTTDVWASMGQEDEVAAREKAFEGYHVDEALMARGAEGAIFLHCLPAHRGEEVAAEVIDGPRSRVFEEAENRLHAQKALLLELID